MDLYSDIFEQILNNKIKTKNELHNAKIVLCRKYSLQSVPSDAELLENAPEDIYELVEPILRTKPMRTISGVAPVAVMTSPAECPHGTCMYCPGGVQYGSAQSYTGHEPASLRAASNDFNPFLQTKSRLEQLTAIGHPTDKIDLIIMGGTFTAREGLYQEQFISGCFSALNGHDVWQTSVELEDLKNQNETAPHRCIGMTIETRPDWCKLPQVDRILKLGGTRVELGVQTVFNDILERISRGHTVQDSIEATRILKDAGLKVCYHMMPGLPGSSMERDKTAFDMIFSNPDFMPDMLKIYPTLVVSGTKLHQDWKNGDYQSLTTENAVKLLADLKSKLPPWVRIQRIQRDIPVQYIDAGVKKSNLRQLVKQRLDEICKKCNCIRCREVGHRALIGQEPDDENIKLLVQKYAASGGQEVFMSYEDVENDILIAFVRLRFPSDDAHRVEFYSNNDISIQDKKPGSAIIRELKVFGPMASLDNNGRSGIDNSDVGFESKISINHWQHRGFGQLLIDDCEKYSSETWGAEKLLIMSGVGVKQYYMKLGYHRDGVYMGKKLK